MRVLVVEDNPSMGAHLEQGLREHGFAVDRVVDGERGFEYAVAGVYDLLILDRMLPGRDGASNFAKPSEPRGCQPRPSS